MKKALITGVAGQDGIYLSRLLLEKGYEVHGMARAVDLPERVPSEVKLHMGDLVQTDRIREILGEVEPDEVYNLAAQSHVGESFRSAEYTGNVTGLGVVRLLDAIRELGLERKTKFYQASSSELYGLVQEVPQNEDTPFHPRSPYGVAKLYGFWTVVTYREAYEIHACNGILFNHESPLRGEGFVTRKISRGAARISLGLQDKLELGNLNAKRDWGHAKEFVEAMWLMLQAPGPDDFVIATGIQASIRDFAEQAFLAVGLKLKWEGSGVEEVGIDRATGRTLVQVNPQFYRVADVENIVGDASKAHRMLGWRPKVGLSELVSEMVEHDLEIAQKEVVALNGVKNC